MSTLFMIAVVVLAVLVGALSLLGAIVMVRVFLAAMHLKRTVRDLPDQLARRQHMLNEQQAAIVEAQRQLAKDRQALSASTKP